MSNAIKVTILIFGILTGLMGTEHGIGEILQGNTAPEAIMILSWPNG